MCNVLKICMLFITNLNSSIICCRSSRATYLFLWVVISTSSSVSSLLCNSFAGFCWYACYFISNFVTNQIFLSCSFWSGFYCIRCTFFSTIKKIWPYLLLKLLSVFLVKTKIRILSHIFYLAVEMNISFLYVIFI